MAQREVKIELDIDLISEELYKALLSELKRTIPNAVYFDEIKITAKTSLESGSNE